MEEKKLSVLEKNLISLLRLFQSRPHHLCKYLLENRCLNDDFLKNISESEKLKEITEKFEFDDIPTIYFINFKDMLKFYEGVSSEYNFDNVDTEKISNELNNRLNDLLKSEKYEEAIKIRDYMIKNNITRKN
jgi:hypothetical protein